MKEPEYKTIRMKAMKWLEIKQLAEQLAEERGAHVSLPFTIAEAVKFFKENRSKS